MLEFSVLLYGLYVIFMKTIFVIYLGVFIESSIVYLTVMSVHLVKVNSLPY